MIEHIPGYGDSALRLKINEIIAVVNAGDFAGGDSTVLVEFGNEERKDFPVVYWRDIREDQSTAPENMQDQDVWITSEATAPGGDPGGEGFSVWGATAPTGTWAEALESGQTVQFGRGFTCSAAGAQFAGGKLWIPASVTEMPVEVTFRLYGPNQDMDDTPVQSKVISMASITAGSYVEGMFDTPQAMASGENWFLSAQFTNAADLGRYIYAPDTRPNGDPITSNGPLGTELAWIAYGTGMSSMYKIGSGSSTQPGSFDQSYPLDCLVTTA